MRDWHRRDVDWSKTVGMTGERRRRGFIKGDERRNIIGQPKPSESRIIGQQHDGVPRDAAHFQQPLLLVPPVMDGQHRHRCSEALVGKGQLLGDTLHDGGGGGRALPDHLRRWFDSGDAATDGLIRSGTRSYVEDRFSRPERGADLVGDPRIGAAQFGVINADDVIKRWGDRSARHQANLAFTAIIARAAAAASPPLFFSVIRARAQA